jgi:hypothetical protein
VGAAPPRPCRDAGDEAELHHVGDALHHVGPRRRGRDAARLPCVARNGIPPLQVVDPRTSPERLRASPRSPARRASRRSSWADVLDQRGAHARVLRRAWPPRSPTAPRWTRLTSRIPGGLLTAGRRAASLRRTSCRAAGDRPVELHSHCTIVSRRSFYARGSARGPGAAHRRRPARARTSNPAVETTLRTSRRRAVAPGSTRGASACDV